MEKKNLAVMDAYNDFQCFLPLSCLNETLPKKSNGAFPRKNSATIFNFWYWIFGLITGICH